jgi:hypothetical protein
MSRRKNRQRKQNRQMSNHHTIPKSLGGKSTVLIHKDIHQKYHSLFGNMHPDQILEYLIEVFWGGYIPRRFQPSTFKEWEE